MFRIARILGLLALTACSVTPDRPQLLEGGAVASPEPRAAEIGAEVLRRGGNAVDAAVAVGFALAVTLPAAGNIGGGGFMLIHQGDEQVAIDYRETAPSAASRDMYLTEAGEVHPNRSRWGHLAAGVPGTVHGLWTAHQLYGSLPWVSLLAPAISLAEEGWPLDEARARRFSVMALLTNALDLNFSRYFGGEKGMLFRQPALAETLKRIASEGPAGFYEGHTADLIVAEMRRGGGLITRSDLRRYRSVIRKPIAASIGDLRIVSMPPPSSGGVALIQMLKMAALQELPERNSSAYIHRIAEIEKRVFADRSHYLGDPDRVRVPARVLISDDYIEARYREIRSEARSEPESISWGKVESEETTHFSIVDRWGQAVSNTYTLNGGYGSGVVVGGAGFLLNNQMDDFSAKPGAPNLYGVTGGEANAIAPGKRMLSSMSPTFVYREGRLWLVLGSPGGPTIFTSVFQVIMNRTLFGMTLDEAVQAPRFHHQWPPRDHDSIRVESGSQLSRETERGLVSLGYTIAVSSPLGDVQAIEIGLDRAHAVSDHRGIGKSISE
ncbi:MAG: gamma-glutamyltransferase [Planctomycetota bacterium]|nr:gamma-glutamyltransferase [Planctomycetota bacterium]